MSKKIISIIVPVFNRANIIVDTISSVLHQTYPYWELIIVDDGSDDDTIRVVNNMAETDERIKLLHRSLKPKGANSCRNIGFDESIGEYLIFLDADDILLPNAIQERVNILAEKPDLDFIVNRSAFFNHDIADADVWWNLPDERNDLERFLVMDVVWQTTGPTWRKSFLVKNNIRFDEFLQSSQDWDFHIQALLAQPGYQHVGSMPDNVIRRNSNLNSISSSHGSHAKLLNRLIHYSEMIQSNPIAGNLAWESRLLFTFLNESVRFLNTRNELPDRICAALMLRNKNLPRDIKLMQRYVWNANRWLHFNLVFHKIYRKLFYEKYIGKKQTLFGNSKYRTLFSIEEKAKWKQILAENEKINKL